jgi:hypothetical protein
VKDFANISSEMPKSGEGKYFDMPGLLLDESYELSREEAYCEQNFSHNGRL